MTPFFLGVTGGPERLLDHCAAMDFDALVLASPFRPGPTGELFLIGDVERAHPALGDHSSEDVLGRLSAAAHERGLGLLLDIAFDRVADGPWAVLLGAQASRRDGDATDPRLPPETRAAVAIAWERPETAAIVADWVAALGRTGLVGLVLRGTGAMQGEAIGTLAATVRDWAGHPTLLAWEGTDGALPHRGLVDAILRPVGRVGAAPRRNDRDPRVLYYPEAPFGPRVVQDLMPSEVAERKARHALRLAAALGDGLLIPAGFEFGERRPLSTVRYNPVRRSDIDLTRDIAAINRLVAAEGAPSQEAVRLSAPDSAIAALLRTDDTQARLVLANTALDRAAEIAAVAFTREAGAYGPFRDLESPERIIAAEDRVRLAPGEVLLLEGRATAPITAPSGPSADIAAQSPRVAIENVTPVASGPFPVRRVVGDVVRVEADIVVDGHGLLSAALLWRPADENRWREVPMRLQANDRWRADFPLERLGRHVFTIEAWPDVFATFRSEIDKKHAAGMPIPLELEEGRRLIAERAEAAEHLDTPEPHETLTTLLDRFAAADESGRLALLLAPETARAMAEADPRSFRNRVDPPFFVDAERRTAAFASWYELFPRSASGDADRHGTFDDVIARLPAIRDMGFDVLYFPPIHPIGRTNRKGRNNALKAGPNDPGSPYAIGSNEGGHDALHPELGGFDAFHRLIQAAKGYGIEIAIDFAIQCSPDHPWLKEHPEWFDWRPDGTIRYAENPPKKYEDIVNVDFYAPGAVPGLWNALRDIVLFWIGHGIRLFRVDNPHTKPLPFWAWMIADVRGRHPDVVFLAEAFTRPKLMYRLAEVGFSQSYTYFTWRNTKAELTDYIEELTTTAPKEFFRPHFFVNTPDINPDFLQDAPRPAFLIRAALAATLSGLWGVYNGFELCEGRPDRTRKEYLDSEKYEIRAWDWDRPGNIVAEITRLNAIREANPALHSHLGTTFLEASGDKILWFERATPERDNVLYVAICLDPTDPQEADVELPLWRWKRPDHGSLAIEDAMSGARFTVRGKYQHIRLDPTAYPFFIWRVVGPKDL
ncbi:maltotransferase domain-containing protein [Segnochrobactrum spirostomi]|uniref:maltotransferase domain-containing protein n=1 Tax=Segnochrobactrum spirostomi TaxID=2608987 RepID=UPI0028A77507|nr:maltotransferase domain-containing protein [Segnochrobactrum spirostomi]